MTLLYHMQVCTVSASALESLQHVNEACSWYNKGIQLANVIASDEEALQLFNLLER